MNDETLKVANRIRSEMDSIERMLDKLEKGHVVELSFNYCGWGISALPHPLLSEEELSDITNNIVKLICMRAEARLDQLKKEFENL